MPMNYYVTIVDTDSASEHRLLIGRNGTTIRAYVDDEAPEWGSIVSWQSWLDFLSENRHVITDDAGTQLCISELVVAFESTDPNNRRIPYDAHRRQRDVDALSWLDADGFSVFPFDF